MSGLMIMAIWYEVPIALLSVLPTCLCLRYALAYTTTGAITVVLRTVSKVNAAM
ncbi:hypothetical protein B9Z19DRAFT_1127857 [Tuber borchii]|uniref:Uncharacterized protein n=1 Tax=Tuber borchii TaxID=42251 RepID=A0A2T6ZQJ2_TUBBO|nr:hypothetical protein B9Z19DRAFT_1127857 [Tuber borchii]